jgi:peptidoglycan/LPS O-acetylase OafA/YrhL
MNSKYFPALTGLRAIAAFMVFIHHYNPFDKDVFGKEIFNFFREFHIGVAIFFVLSGFLIAYRYFDLDKINFKQYLINRFARIYPMYFILTTISFLLYAIFKSQSSWSDLCIYFFNITFLRGYFDDLKFTGIAQGWSLSVEEIFYFAAPFFFILIKKSKLFLFILPSLVLFLGFYLVFIYDDINFYGFMRSIAFMLDYTFFGRVFEFFIGIILALIVKNNQNYSTKKGFTYFGIITILVLVFCLSILKTGNGFGTDSILGKMINALLLPLFGIAPLLFGLIYEKTLVSIILESKLFILLGKSSYIFYLIHIGIFVVAFNKISHNLVLQFLILNIISIILYKFVERPLNFYIRNRITNQVIVIEKKL